MLSNYSKTLEKNFTWSLSVCSDYTAQDDDTEMICYGPRQTYWQFYQLITFNPIP